MIRLASTKDARTHAHLEEFVLKMLYAMFKPIDHCVYVKKVSQEMHNSLVTKLVAALIMIVQQRMLASTGIVWMFANKFNADETQFVDQISVIMHAAIVWMVIEAIH